MAPTVEAPLASEDALRRPFYSVSEAAALVGVSRVTIWRWIKSGRLSPARLGHRTVRIPHEDMVRLLEPASRDAASMPHSERGHFVLFYEADAFLENSVAAFMAAGMRQAGPALVVATPRHRDGIAEQLRALRIDVDDARRNGQYVELDAEDTLGRFMLDGLLDAARFRQFVAAMPTELGPGVRIFGEMVALLVDAGNPEAALALEGLWNNLQQEHQFQLLCGYPMQQMAGKTMAAVLDRACDAHGTVVPAESYSRLDTTTARLRQIVALQQRAASLEQALEAERAARAEAQAAQREADKLAQLLLLASE